MPRREEGWGGKSTRREGKGSNNLRDEELERVGGGEETDEEELPDLKKKLLEARERVVPDDVIMDEKQVVESGPAQVAAETPTEGRVRDDVLSWLKDLDKLTPTNVDREQEEKKKDLNIFPWIRPLATKDTTLENATEPEEAPGIDVNDLLDDESKDILDGKPNKAKGEAKFPPDLKVSDDLDLPWWLKPAISEGKVPEKAEPVKIVENPKVIERKERVGKNTGLVWYEKNGDENGIMEDLQILTAPDVNISKENLEKRRLLAQKMENRGIRLPKMSTDNPRSQIYRNRELLQNDITFLNALAAGRGKDEAIRRLAEIGIGRGGVEYLPESPMAKVIEEKQKPVEKEPKMLEETQRKIDVADSLKNLVSGSEESKKSERGFLEDAGVNVGLVDKLLKAQPESLIKIANIYERAIRGEVVKEEEVTDVRELVAILGLRW